MKCVIFLFRVTSQYKCSSVFIANAIFISNKKPKCKILSNFIQLKVLLFGSFLKNMFFVVFF